MNKKISILLISVMSLTLLLVGCDNKGVGTQNSDTTNNSTPTAEEQEIKDSTQKEEVQQDSTTQKENSLEKTTKGEAKKDETKKEITVFEYNVEEDNLIETAVTLDKVDENTLFSKLQDLGVISKTAKLNSFKTEDIDGVKTAVIDVNSNFINTNLGSGPEEYMLKAFANTYIKNMGVKQVKLTVDGSNYESGHIILEDGDFLK